MLKLKANVRTAGNEVSVDRPHISDAVDDENSMSVCLFFTTLHHSFTQRPSFLLCDQLNNK